MLIRNARLFMPDGTFRLSDIAFGEAITNIGSIAGEGFDAGGMYLLPGFIDLHTHGAMGGDFSDGIAGQLPKMAAFYAAHGVTSFLATTMTLPEDTLCRAAKAISDFRPQAGMAVCAGINMEGPFLSDGKRGAHNRAYLAPPSPQFFESVQAASGGMVKLVTIAPELEGACEFISSLKGCRASIGHTEASYQPAMEGFTAGATQLTHLFNAMPSLLHRDPGPIGAAMDAGAWAELICDGYHVHPSAVRAAFAMFPERILLISDSLRCAGMPDGDYELGGQPITLSGGCCTLKGKSTIAGSIITVHDAFKRAVSFGIPLETAAAAATHNPAEAAGLTDRGYLRKGLRADMVLLDEQLELVKVFIGGVDTAA